MKICKKSQAMTHKNSESCVVTACTIKNDLLNIAVADIKGRYPEAGYAVNHQVHEMVYIQSGSGAITLSDQVIEFSAGDVILIEPGDYYFWQGEFTGVIACNPAFTAEQHEVVDMLAMDRHESTT